MESYESFSYFKQMSFFLFSLPIKLITILQLFQLITLQFKVTYVMFTNFDLKQIMTSDELRSSRKSPQSPTYVGIEILVILVTIYLVLLLLAYLILRFQAFKIKQYSKFSFYYLNSPLIASNNPQTLTNKMVEMSLLSSSKHQCLIAENMSH